MTEIRELTESEAMMVGGGNIVDDLYERFPFGEWWGGSFWPNGAPDFPPTTPTPTPGF